MQDHIILGIESSCDETAAAVYSKEHGVLSNELFSQTELHKKYGGVVPEVASRSHIEKIPQIVQLALDKAGKTWADIDAIAVTNKPGLPGSLLVGVCFAKAIAWAQHKKLIGVNHLEGHAFSSFLDNTPPFPHLCLTASGGHTSLYLVKDFGDYEVIGQTRDDAAGEAFDKIAKLLNLAYPGGPIIEKLAQEEHFQDFFHYPRASIDSPDFSFSGLKTAVLYDLVKKGAYNLAEKKQTSLLTPELKKQVASSLLVAIKDIFIIKIAQALKKYPHVKAVTFVGGVACNKFIKQAIKEYCQEHGLEFFSPQAQFCTDNAAMIAFVGNYKAKKNEYSDLNLDIF
ncbi:MAG: tRNA (adenosine(37)-N6)-threonylcarbamoyltransferase complex transferase subunit TsaD [Candidatus Babeliales bacterium]